MAECIRDDSTDCDCSRCGAVEDAFWREQGESDERFEFDVGDLDDGPCTHVFNGDRCDRCGAEYDPIAHGHRIVPEDAW